MDKIVSFFAVLAFVLIGSGCATEIVEGQRPGQYVPQASIQMNSAGFATLYLADKVAIERNAWSRSATGTVQVVAMLRNRTDYPQVIELQTMFFDQNKMPLGNPSTWEKVFLQPQAFANYSCLSTDVDAAYFYVQIREAK